MVDETKTVLMAEISKTKNLLEQSEQHRIAFEIASRQREDTLLLEISKIKAMVDENKVEILQTKALVDENKVEISKTKHLLEESEHHRMAFEIAFGKREETLLAEASQLRATIEELEWRKLVVSEQHMQLLKQEISQVQISLRESERHRVAYKNTLDDKRV